MVHARRTSCRVCGDGPLEVFLELGPQPLANAFPASPAEFGRERFFPLGVALCAGKGIETSHGTGALTHFQALTAALSGTVGLGAIAGMAIAVEFGGPGAVFWMWTVGIIGMALKTTEVTLSLLYRDVSDPANPHGGSMYVLRKGLKEIHPALEAVGKALAMVFVCALLLFAVTGGNMFQTWTVADTTREYLGVPTWISGVVIATLAGIVLIGGIKRIGGVTKILVPFKCGVYVLIGMYVIAHNSERLPEAMRLIFSLAINIIMGFEANDLLRWTYARRGYEEVGLVQGDDLDEAEIRFFSETALPAQPDVPPPPPPGLSRNWKSSEPDFIFPGLSRT